MKTHLPTAITTVQEAKDFLKALWTNGESYHPDDSAGDIVLVSDGCYQFTDDEATALNTLMDAIHALDFDPSEYLLELDFRLAHYIDKYEQRTGYKVNIAITEPEGEECVGYGPNFHRYLAIIKDNVEVIGLAWHDESGFCLMCENVITQKPTLKEMETAIAEAFSVVYGDDEIEPHSVEHLFDMDKDELEQEIVYKACDVRKLANDIDTAFEVIRVSWDNPTPQANQTINEAWAQVRRVLGQVTKEGKLK